jgi:hypothetical protein
MKIHRGKHLKYLGMDLDFSTNGASLQITMPEYIKELLKTWESVATKEKGTNDCAAPKDLFAVDNKCEKLATTAKEKYHSILAKILFAMKRARPDSGISISFLTTRVRDPDKDN